MDNDLTVEEQTRINQKVLNTKLKDLIEWQNTDDSGYTDFVGYFSNLLEDIEGPELKNAGELTLLDLLFYIDHMKGNPGYEENEKLNRGGIQMPKDSQDYFFCLRVLLVMLVKIGRKNLPIKLFLGQSIDLLYNCITCGCCKSTVIAEMNSLKKILNCEYSVPYEKMTVEAALFAIDKHQNSHWRMTQESLCDYGYRVLDAYRMIARVLIDPFKLAYPAAFCQENHRCHTKL